MENNKKRIRVYWKDEISNYNKEDENKIINYFSQKYNISKKYISVHFVPCIKENNELQEIWTDFSLTNVMSQEYQRKLFKEFLNKKNYNYDFERIIKIDDEVNQELNYDIVENRSRKYRLKWITVNNFLCFGDVGKIDLTQLKGIVCVTSLPENTGGKTTFSIDIPYFLFFGKTTKTEVNLEIFNTYLKNSNEVNVCGLIEIDGVDYLIERKLIRSAKKDGDYNVRSLVNYYKVVNGIKINESEEDSKKTTKIIKDTIGTEDDFMTMVMATAKNLDDLIFALPSEKTKLINRFLGLEVLELKEEIIRKKYNEFAKKMLSNHYNIIDLEEKNTEYSENISQLIEIKNEQQIKINDIISQIENLKSEKENLYNKKYPIDEEYLKLNPTKLEEELKQIESQGVKEKKRIDELQKELIKYQDIVFDEVLYQNNLKEKRFLEKEIDQYDNKIFQIENEIIQLKTLKVCIECGRPYDNTEKILLREDNVKELKKIKNEKEVKLQELNNIISELEVFEKQVLDKAKLELEIDKTTVEINHLRNEYKSKKNDLTKYYLNQDKIQYNRNIESNILKVNTEIQMLEHEKERYIRNVEKLSADILKLENDIKANNLIIEKIKIEQEQEKYYLMYIELVGKKGINKLVMQTVLPIINNELHRLLGEVVDFDVEVQIDNKNNLEIYIINDGVTKKLKSGSGYERTVGSLALRFILGQISTLPKLNFIAFDEVFGAVADVNYENIRILFEKAIKNYDLIYLITHEKQINDWSDYIVNIQKKRNIAKVSLIQQQK